MATTPNFGWVTPAPTDFVTDLPADFETFADAVDADAKLIKDTADAAISETLIDAAGDLIYGSAADTAARLAIGTANQVLAVNSGATAPEWITPSADIPQSIFDAKGDIIAATAADTAARLAVGANGTVLTADSGETTGLKWSAPAAALTLLASGSLSSTTVSVTGLDQTYRELWIYVIDGSSGSNIDFNFKINNNNSAIYGAYTDGGANVSSLGVQLNVSPAILANDGNLNAKIALPQYATTTAYKYLEATVTFKNSASNWVQYDRSAIMITDSAITSIQLIATSSWNAGTYEIYGVK